MLCNCLSVVILVIASFYIFYHSVSIHIYLFEVVFLFTDKLDLLLCDKLNIKLS